MKTVLASMAVAKEVKVGGSFIGDALKEGGAGIEDVLAVLRRQLVSGKEKISSSLQERDEIAKGGGEVRGRIDEKASFVSGNRKGEELTAEGSDLVEIIERAEISEALPCVCQGEGGGRCGPGRFIKGSALQATSGRGEDQVIQLDAGNFWWSGRRGLKLGRPKADTMTGGYPASAASALFHRGVGDGGEDERRTPSAMGAHARESRVDDSGYARNGERSFGDIRGQKDPPMMSLGGESLGDAIRRECAVDADEFEVLPLGKGGESLFTGGNFSHARKKDQDVSV